MREDGFSDFLPLIDGVGIQNLSHSLQVLQHLYLSSYSNFILTDEVVDKFRGFKIVADEIFSW